MLTLYDKLASQEVTRAKSFDPVQVIQEVRRICLKSDQLGGTVVTGRKTLAFLRALPDSHANRSRLYSYVIRQYGGIPTFGDMCHRFTMPLESAGNWLEVGPVVEVFQIRYQGA